MNKEDYFIKKISNSKYQGDDGAFIKNYVYSMDAFCEDVHFKRSWLSLEQIAKKAMLINISDAIVMNAKPKYALLSLAIPKDFTKNDLKTMAKAFKNIAKEYKIKIIGGDTICNTKLDISITIVSKCKKPIFRSGAKIGDLLCYTNDLGSVKKDLDILLASEVKGKKNQNISKKSKFIEPILHGEFFYEASKYISSAIDISDGLFFEMKRISKASKIGFEIFKKIPDEIAMSGEEYEILFTFDEKYKQALEELAKKHKIRLNIIGKAIEGSFNPKLKGWHFED